MRGEIVSLEAADWQGFLDADEQIVWQGTPSGKLRLEFRSAFEPLLAAIFTGLSIFWMVGASESPGPPWMFCLLLFLFGSYILLGVHFWRAYLRTQSHLTLTNKRALIATTLFGRRKLKSYPITPSTQLEYVDGPLGSIFFAKEDLRNDDGNSSIPIGFELIDDARSVFALFRKVQEGLGR